MFTLAIAIAFAWATFINSRAVKQILLEKHVAYGCIYCLSLGIGAVAGAYFGFYADYSVSKGRTTVFYGFPVPYGISRFENGVEVGYVSHFPMAIAVMNAVFVAMFCTLPCAMTVVLLRSTSSKGGEENGSGMKR
jgi:hypothetical protein